MTGTTSLNGAWIKDRRVRQCGEEAGSRGMKRSRTTQEGVTGATTRRPRKVRPPEGPMTRGVRRSAGSLSRQLAAARAAERRRIGQELHDDVCQRVAALEMMVSDAQAHPHRDRAAVLEELRCRLSQLAADIRTLSRDMSRPALQGAELEPRLRAFVDELSRHAPVRIDLGVGPLPDDLTSEAALCAYRIVQEGLSNVVRHADARGARVELIPDDGHLRIDVIDDGRGFEPRGPAVDGVGLTGMQHRLDQVGGRFDLDSAPGRGTRIHAWIPLSC
jgi:signal transduction histidine kinase